MAHFLTLNSLSTFGVVFPLTISLDRRPADNNENSTFLMSMKRLNAPFNFMFDKKLLT